MFAECVVVSARDRVSAREFVTKNLRPRHRRAIEDSRLMRFEKHLRYLDQTRRYSIVPASTGWEVREERDSEVVRKELYRDWHRVERVRRSMVTELDELRAEGWRDVN